MNSAEFAVRPSATMRAAPVAGASCADGCAGSEDKPAPVPGQDTPAQAAFNPFGTVGIIVPPLRPPATEVQGGTWAPSLIATLVGAVVLAAMLRVLAS